MRRLQLPLCDSDMILFTDKNRNATDSRSRVEGQYEYLDRSARPEAARVRSLLNHWIARFPEKDANELCARMIKGDDKAFTSATFEIILFAFLNRMGFEVEIHPDLENGSKKSPDFRAVAPNGTETFVEAVLASEHSAEEIAADRRKQVVLQALEKLDSPNFCLHVDIRGNPEMPPPSKPLRHYLSTWLKDLDPDEVISNPDGNRWSIFPSTIWDSDGWRLEFKAIPIKPDKRGRNKRIIFAESSGGGETRNLAVDPR